MATFRDKLGPKKTFDHLFFKLFVWTKKLIFDKKKKKNINIIETEYPSKPISDSPSANLEPLFNSNVTKLSAIKWSQNWSGTIKSGVFGIAVNFKITCFAFIGQRIEYANNTTSDGLSAILRPIYKW